MSNFKGVPDTLFIPLTARIYISKRFPHYFFDPKCLELEKIIPQELLVKKSNQYQNFANVACSFNMDKIVKRFIEEHNETNIVNLGCGLETNYWRINDNRATFYELDFPEVIENRKTVLGESEKDILLPYSLIDLRWTELIDRSKPTLMTARGVFEYFHIEDVVKFLDEVREKLPHAEVVFDCPNSRGIGYTNRYVKKTGNTSAMIYFYVDDGQEFANKCNAELISEDTFFTETRKIVKKGLNLYTKIAMRVVDKGGMGKIIHMKL